MLALLKSLPRLDGCNYVFFAARGGALSDSTIGKVMRSLHEADVKADGKGFVDAKSGVPAVPHGLRASFRTWVSERTTFDSDLAEVALFHTIGSKTEQTYGCAPCPVCQADQRRDQNALTLGDGRRGLLLHCKKSGCDFRDILAAAGLRDGDYVKPDPVEILRRKLQRDRIDDQRTEAAKRV